MSTEQTDPNPPGDLQHYPEELSDSDTLLAVAGWAHPFLELDDVPVFGSAEWLALDLTDQRRAAAVVRAALAWWGAGEPADQVETAYRAQAMKRAMAEAGPFSRTGVRDAMVSPDVPTFAELEEHRWLADHRPEDHPGGPVELWGPVRTTP